MKIVLFAHSLLSDWNHGNAHFLRGIVSDLQARGHHVRVYESADAWSAVRLSAEHGAGALDAVHEAYPSLHVTRYEQGRLDLHRALDGVDLVLVHEWNTHDLVRRIGAHRRRHRYVLLFHDTHHRSVSKPKELAGYDLSEYDGVLAFGDVIRERYAAAGWGRQAWTWHEAADTRVFYPRNSSPTADLVWVGNWGDEERTAELSEYLLRPVAELGASGHVFGVRYPADAVQAVHAAGLQYGGWVPNFRTPWIYGLHRVTIHVPRRPYVQVLPGIPTIRPFEALACGIPLVSAPWKDVDGLFTPGRDYLLARNGVEMTRHLRDVLADAALARSLASHGLHTIAARHTCAHRVDELLEIVRAVQTPVQVDTSESLHL